MGGWHFIIIFLWGGGVEGCGWVLITPVYSLPHAENHDWSLSCFSVIYSAVCCSIAIREAALKSQMPAREW